MKEQGRRSDPWDVPASQPRGDECGQLAGAAERTPEPVAGWVPIRRLGPRHRSRILQHLLALGPQDRYLRFGHIATDDQVRHYVEQLDFDRDELFGVFNRRLRLVAMAHLAFAATDTDAAPASAEFGVSVAAHLGGRGLGQRLFAHAQRHARNRHVHELIVLALSENVPMLRIARRAGATVERTGSESSALLRLRADSLASHVGALVDEGAAGIDYGLKREARRVDRLLASLVGD